MRLVADRTTGRLLGGQVIGRRGVAGRTNVIATALHCEMTAEHFADLDLGYAPQMAPLHDPLLLAADELLG